MIYYNGQFAADDQVHVSPFDRAVYFGDGIYEVFRVYQGAIFEKEAHFARLERSAAAVMIALPCTITEIEAICEKLLAENQVADGMVYLQISRAIAPRNHAFPANPCPPMLAYSIELNRPLANMRSGVSAITVPDIRWLRCDIKSLNLLPNVMAKQKAAEQGAGEAILHRGDTVTECSSSNVMMVKEDVIYTHPLNHLILAGITRGVILRLARESGINLLEKAFTLNDLFRADEVFYCSTTSEIMPIVRIDGRQVSNGVPGSVTRRLQDAYERLL